MPVTKKTRTGVSSSDFTSKNVDFEGEADKNSAIGKDGEDKVVEYENVRFLVRAGHPELALKVTATRDTISNAARYDVQSYEEDGSIRHIEVKTTTGAKNNRFHISEREVAFSEQHSDSYYLYRVYDFDKNTGQGKMYIMKGVIDRSTLTPTNYIV